MLNILGNPYEDGLAAMSLVFGGVLDAFPRLDVYLPHGGGTFPWLVGRADFAIQMSPMLKYMKQPASAYLRRFHYVIKDEMALINRIVRSGKLNGTDAVLFQQLPLLRRSGGHGCRFLFE